MLNFVRVFVKAVFRYISQSKERRVGYVLRTTSHNAIVPTDVGPTCKQAGGARRTPGTAQRPGAPIYLVQLAHALNLRIWQLRELGS